MRWVIADVICVAIISGTALFLDQWCEVGEGLHVFFAVIGSITFFFGKYFTGSGFFVRYHYVNAPTPEIIWKATGVICWIAAAITFFYHLP